MFSQPEARGGPDDPFSFLSKSYEPGTVSAQYPVTRLVSSLVSTLPPLYMSLVMLFPSVIFLYLPLSSYAEIPSKFSKSKVHKKERPGHMQGMQWVHEVD